VVSRARRRGRYLQDMINTKTLLALSLFAGACGEADGGPEAEFREALATDVRAIADTGVVGVQAEHAFDGQHLFASEGFADRAAGAPITNGSRFRIASTTKAFVMATTLALAESGELSLDDSVETWLPGVVAANGNDGAQITVRHLLQHRSGLNNHVEDLFAQLAEARSAGEVDVLLKKTWTPRALVALATSHPALFPPGTAFAYSDTGYVLIGMIIEAATGETWQAQLAQRVLEPLRLRDTSTPGSSTEIPGAHMHGYAQLPFADGWVDVTSISPSSLDAAASIISTPQDVDTFFRALLHGDLFGPALMAEMKATLPVDEEGERRYGLGLAWSSLACGGGYYMHEGDTLGFHTRNGVSEDGLSGVCIAISGDAELGFEAEARHLIERALCEPR
jgi:D-alanyl-D-alanine carboxypeptidase